MFECRVSNSFLHLQHLDCKRFHINFCQLEKLSNIINTIVFFNFLRHLTMLITITTYPSASLHTGTPLGFLSYSTTGSLLPSFIPFYLPHFHSCVHLLKVSQCVMSLQPHGLQPSRLPCPWYFSRRKYWIGRPFPSPGNLLDPGIKPMSLTSPSLAGRFFIPGATWVT